MNEETRALYAAIGRGETVQFQSAEGNWINWCMNNVAPGNSNVLWRIKPREILVNGVRVPAPLMELPEGGTIWTPELSHDCLCDDWMADGEVAEGALKLGIAHATKEAAIAHAKAMLIRVPA